MTKEDFCGANKKTIQEKTDANLPMLWEMLKKFFN